MKTFYKLLAVTLIAVTANNFVWFALTYWAYLSTRSVISTSVMAGVFLILTALSGIWMGSIVDHHKKKLVMLGSSFISLLVFIIGLIILQLTPASAFTSISSVMFWVFIVTLLCGTLVGTIYNIAIPTLVALIVPENQHDRANGMFGTIVGISFAITSVISGITLAFGGMSVVILIAAAATVIAMILLSLINIPEKEIIHLNAAGEVQGKRTDLRGTIQAVKAIPGLFALIFFTTFNNFLGGIFFSLMDAYGLSLVTVQQWGVLWGVISLSFIASGLYISKKGLGNNLMRTLFRNNIIVWTVCIFFTVQPSILLLAIGTFIWMFLSPFTEAIEQTIFQKVVPVKRLGRVIGFAHSVEQAASPLTAFMIGPIAQLIFIPFMTTGKGVELIGDAFGTGVGRGIALVFTLAGIVGLAVTLIAMRSKSYKLLGAYYHDKPATETAKEA